MTNSCGDCPNMIPEDEAEKHSGHDFGVPICGTLGPLLGQPGESEQDRLDTFNHFASGCSRYGVKGADANNPQRRVFSGSEAITASLMGPLTPDRPEVARCSGCANYIPAHNVRDKFGWNAGACAMYGCVLGGNQAMTMPKACPGHANKDWVKDNNIDILIRNGADDPFEGLELLSGYSGNPVGVVVKTTSRVASGGKPRPKATSLDPRKGPFHREATDDELAVGILGFNIFTMDSGKMDLEYPVFAESQFDADEIAKIPTSLDGSGIHLYQDFDDALFQLYGAMMNGSTPIFVGDAGTGKTEAFRFMAYLMGLPFTRISISKATEADDLTGSWVLKDGNMEWIYGDLCLIDRPGVVIVDEPNMGMNDVWEIMRPLMDNARYIKLTKKDGEMRVRHHYNFFGMAMNPAWDPKYIGAQEQSIADGSRTVTISAGYPPVTVEKRILRDRCKMGNPTLGVAGFAIEKDDLTTIMKISEDIRAACDRSLGGELEFAWGVRSNLAIAQLSNTFDLKHCYRLVATNALDPDQAAIIHALVEGVIR